MIYKEIQKKQKQVDSEKHNMRIVEDNLTELETMQDEVIEQYKRNDKTVDQYIKDLVLGRNNWNYLCST